MSANHDDHHDAPDGHGRALRLGIGGPVGSGKTALTAALCRSLGPSMRLGVVTNDIYTTEDADFLRRAGVIDPARIMAVQTGCCPHTAIRDDIAANIDAVETLEERFGPLDLVIVESGGDNLTATFSRGLADRQIFVLDVSGGDKVPAREAPGDLRRPAGGEQDRPRPDGRRRPHRHVPRRRGGPRRQAGAVHLDPRGQGRPLGRRMGRRHRRVLAARTRHPPLAQLSGMKKALVRARAVLRTGLDDRGLTRLETLRSDPPLTLRQTAPGQVHLVSTGAGPWAATTSAWTSRWPRTRP